MEAQTLYEDNLSVKLALPDREERVALLTIRLEQTVRKPHNQKVLNIQWTEESDPFFLYSLTISEDEFQVLKQEQCLLVDFPTFPSKLVELLERCRHDMTSREDNSAPRFVAVLGLKNIDTMFSIVESNNFKHLDHLALRVRAGSDASIKQYLASRLYSFKVDNERLARLYKESQKTVLTKQEELTRLSIELAQYRETMTSNQNRMQLEHATSLSAERERSLSTLNAAQQKHELDLKDLTRKHEMEAALLKSNVDSLHADNKELFEAKHRLSTQVQELTKRLDVAERDLEQAQRDVRTLRAENKALDTVKFEHEKTINQHLIKISTLEQQLKDKEEVSQNHSHLTEAANSQRAHLEESLALYKQNSAALEDKVKCSILEINKGNDIIQRLQKDIRSYRVKLKKRKHLAAQLNADVQKRKEALDSQVQRQSALQSELIEKKGECDRLHNSLEEALKRLEDAKQVIQSNEKMITFLNNQVTESQLINRGPAFPTTSAFRPSFSSSIASELPPPARSAAPRSVPATRLVQPVLYNPRAPASSSSLSAGANAGVGAGSTVGLSPSVGISSGLSSTAATPLSPKPLASFY